MNNVRHGNVGVETNTLEVAINRVLEIKESILNKGNQISCIVYSIQDKLKERNACKQFVERTGMSKASISKMLTAETLRREHNIADFVSYNLIYKLKDIMSQDVVDSLNEGMSESEIRSALTKQGIDTAEDTAEDTRSEIVTQIWDILNSYDIDKEDVKMLKMLIKGLR